MARLKGNGTLYKKPDSKIYIAKWIVNGKSYTRSTGCTNKRDAEKKCAEFTHSFRLKKDIDIIENLQAKIRVKENELNEIADEYSILPIEKINDRYFSLANSSTVTESTKDNYDNMLNVLVDWVSANTRDVRLVKDIDREITESFLSSYKIKVSANRYNCFLSHFKRIWTEFGKLSSHKCFKDNPWMNFRYQKVTKPFKRDLTTEELIAVLENAECMADDISLLICLGIYTGMRISDCCELKNSEIDIAKGYIQKIPVKTKKYQTVVKIPIHHKLMEKIIYQRQKIQDRINRGEVLCDEETEYLNYKLYRQHKTKNIRIRLQKLFKKAGIKTIEKIDGKNRTIVSFGSLRRSFVSIISNAGFMNGSVNLDVIRSLVGHTTLKTTLGYNRTYDSTLQKAISNLPSIDGEIIHHYIDVQIEEELVSELKSRFPSKSVSDVLREYLSSSHYDVIQTETVQ